MTPKKQIKFNGRDTVRAVARGTGEDLEKTVEYLISLGLSEHESGMGLDETGLTGGEIAVRIYSETHGAVKEFGDRLNVTLKKAVTILVSTGYREYKSLLSIVKE